MFERFTGKARNVVVQAQAEAREQSDPRIQPEHLLLGMLSVYADELVPLGVTPERAEQAVLRLRRRPFGLDDADAVALRVIGIDVDEVLRSIEQNIGAGDPKKRPRGHIPFAPAAKKLLERSLREAVGLHHGYIGLEHLFLALLDSGTANDLGVSYVQVRGLISRSSKAG
jgi:ATP-dependent Clp protease ATP-binding subunit ClpA